MFDKNLTRCRNLQILLQSYVFKVTAWEFKKNGQIPSLLKSQINAAGTKLLV